MGELYGEINKLTLEWNDGLMAMTVRKCVQVALSLVLCYECEFVTCRGHAHLTIDSPVSISVWIQLRKTFYLLIILFIN